MADFFQQQQAGNKEHSIKHEKFHLGTKNIHDGRMPIYFPSFYQIKFYPSYEETEWFVKEGRIFLYR